MNKLKILFLLLIALSVTVISYYPIFESDFINWDDNKYITENEAIKDFSLKNIKKIFTSSFVSMYTPITILSYAVEYKLFGLNPYAYHTTNLILHLFNVLLVFWLFFLISKDKKVSFFVSVFFAIHPMHVESVAWIPERKGVLCALFYLGSLVSYTLYLKNLFLKKYLIFSLILFIMSLFTKPVAISLPFILLLFDIYYNRKQSRYSIIEKIPFFILTIFFSAITVYTQSDAINRELLYSFAENIIFFFYRSLFYFVKIFVPFKLSCIYPYPEKINGSLPVEYLLSPLIFIFLLVLIIITLIKLKDYRKTIFFGLSFFYITIAPVMQIIPVGQAIVADRYTYIPYLGLFYIIAVFLFKFYKDYVRVNTVYIAIFTLALASLIGFFGYLTWQRCHVWQNSITLWSDFISKYPRNVSGYNNRGGAYFLKGEYEKAFQDYQTALKFKPDHIPTLYNLCILYRDIGRYQEAITVCKKTIELKNDYMEAYENLGNVYLSIGNFNEAIKIYKEAIEKNKTFIPAYINLGVIYYFKKEYDSSYRYFRHAIELGGKIHPDFNEFIENYSNKHGL